MSVVVTIKRDDSVICRSVLTMGVVAREEAFVLCVCHVGARRVGAVQGSCDAGVGGH